MVGLRNFTVDDGEFIKENFYPAMSINDIIKMINNWNTYLYSGLYFEMFAVCSDDVIVGSVSLFDHENGKIGAGPTILEKYRKKGYGFSAVETALEIARKKGYAMAVAQIRVDNTASILLHEKLKFSVINKGINKKGNEVFYLEKWL